MWAGREERENKMERSVAIAHRETGFDICGSAELLWGGRSEQGDSSELWGKGCDHSVIRHYCHNAHTEEHTMVIMYKHFPEETLMYEGRKWCTQTHKHMRVCTGNGGPPCGVQPRGGNQHLSPGSHTK